MPMPIIDSQPVSGKQMGIDLDEIRLALLEEYEQTGNVDIALWISRYPEHREEIIDYWLWVKGTPRGSEMEMRSSADLNAHVAEQMLRDACLAVNLGPQWLEATAQPDGEGEELGRQLEVIRATPRGQLGKASIAFRKAAIFTWVVSILEKQRTPVSRLAVQKATYVLEAAMNLGVFAEHKRKPLGPYDYKARYKDAEPIAIRKGWLAVNGSVLSAADRANEARRFAARYVRSESLAERLIAYLARLSDGELETLTTVHSVVHTSAARDRSLTAEEVRQDLAASKEWQDKTRRENFSVPSIGRALKRLEALRLLRRR